ncbi:MAG: hypothetical protein HY040_27525 [Planctomycetes bacterium]|nr:hypothetical protein [Planctomycetota bacterium]
MTPAADKTVAAKTAPCPRCGQPLMNAAELGWCQACGYCRSLDDTANLNLLPEEPAQPTTAAVAVQQAGYAVSRIPWWFYVLVTGVVAIAWLSIWRSRTLAPEGLPRALWTTVQIGAGVLLLLVGQFIGLVRAAPEDSHLSTKDMFVPFHLWSQVLRRANRLYEPLLMASWGLAIALSACIFIGGLGHWMTYLPGGKNGPAKRIN